MCHDCDGNKINKGDLVISPISWRNNSNSCFFPRSIALRVLDISNEYVLIKADQYLYSQKPLNDLDSMIYSGIFAHPGRWFQKLI